MTTWGAVAVAAVVGLVVAGWGVAWWLRRTFLITTVYGRSMLPTYSDGDRLLVRRVPVAAIRRGDVVVLAGDELPGELIIKRAAAVPGDPVPPGIPVTDQVVPAGQLVALGDNPDASYDSRKAGYFAVADLVGVVVRPMR